MSELRIRELAPEACYQELNRLGISEDNIQSLASERIQEIVAYTGEDTRTVIGKINNSIEQACVLWGELKPNSEEELLRFHSQTTRKIYSMTAIGNYLAVIRERIIQRILRRGKQVSILDFGGSHGHLTIAAGQAGLDVTYADIGLEIRKFVQWRVGQRNLKVNFAPIEDNRCVIGDETYDYIICLDVMSHLPNLPRYMEDFHRWLKDGGEFFVGDDLYDFNVPWHLDENIRYVDAGKKVELFKDFKLIEHLWANCDVWGKVCEEDTTVSSPRNVSNPTGKSRIQKNKDKCAG